MHVVKAWHCLFRVAVGATVWYCVLLHVDQGVQVLVRPLSVLYLPDAQDLQVY